MGKNLTLGLVLTMHERPDDGAKPTWSDIRNLAILGEVIGADTLWIADEILWTVAEWPGPRGWWECWSMAGAVAASTSRASVGTWVMSAVQRNPAMIVKCAETLDEISGGRFTLGLGAGHAGGATKFGYPTDNKISRYLEALEIIVPLLRGKSDVSFDGSFHRAFNADVRPRGPRPGHIPLMMGGHSTRTMTAAVAHADTWSAYATESSLPEAFEPMTAQLDRICEEAGRDPASIGRSVGVFVEPGDEHLAEAAGFGTAITGSINHIADTIARFAEVGVTRVEVVPWPPTVGTVEKVASIFTSLQ